MTTGMHLYDEGIEDRDARTRNALAGISDMVLDIHVLDRLGAVVF